MWLWGALVALVVVAAYVPAIKAPFIFDDIPSIQSNESIRTLWPVSKPLSPPSGDLAVSGRPIANYSFALDYAVNRWLGVDQRGDPLGRNKTLAYHLTNLALHLLCGFLLFALVRAALGLRALEGTTIERNSAALIVAGIWLAHPLQTEAVNYLVQRTELLGAVCYLATLYAAFRAWDPGPARLRWCVIAVVLCAIGMASKETMVSAPIAVVLFDRAFLASSWKEIGSRRDRLGLYVALLTTELWVVWSIISGQRSGTVGFNLGIRWYDYLVTQCWAIGHYFALSVWPSALTLDYGDAPIRAWSAIPAGVLLAVTLGLTIRAWIRDDSRRLPLAFVSACFFLLLGPSSSVVPIVTEVAAERRFYLPLACALIPAILALRRIPMGILAGVFVILATLTARRSDQYARPETLWREVIARRPENPRGYVGLGFTMLHEEPPRLADAEPVLVRALQIDPHSLAAMQSLTKVAMRTGRFSDAKQLIESQRAIKPTTLTAAQLGMVLVSLRDTASAGPYLDQAQIEELADNDPTGVTVLGFAAANMATGRWARASEAFQRAHELQPERADILLYLADALSRQGRDVEAARYMEVARRLRANPQP